MTTRLTNAQADAFYKTGVWQKCRVTILERDDYLCQECLGDEGEPIPADTVHHIEHLRDNPSRALDETNLISVCFDCHNVLHPEKGFGQTKEKNVSNKITVYELSKNQEQY